jgi:hypothetical protein
MIPYVMYLKFVIILFFLGGIILPVILYLGGIILPLEDMDKSSSHSSPRGEDRSSQSGEEDNQLRRYSR